MLSTNHYICLTLLDNSFSILFKPSYPAFMFSAVFFIRLITTVIIVITAPTVRDTFVVVTAEFTLRTLSILAATHFFIFIRVISTVIFKVT